MKKLCLLFTTSVAIVLASCSKDNNPNPAHTKPSIDNTKIGQTVTVNYTVSGTGQWLLAVYEYDANTNQRVFAVDSVTRGNFSVRFSPHVNNKVTVYEQVNLAQPVDITTT